MYKPKIEYVAKELDGGGYTEIPVHFLPPNQRDCGVREFVSAEDFIRGDSSQSPHVDRKTEYVVLNRKAVVWGYEPPTLYRVGYSELWKCWLYSEVQNME